MEIFVCILVVCANFQRKFKILMAAWTIFKTLSDFWAAWVWKQRKLPLLGMTTAASLKKQCNDMKYWTDSWMCVSLLCVLISRGSSKFWWLLELFPKQKLSDFWAAWVWKQRKLPLLGWLRLHLQRSSAMIWNTGLTLECVAELVT